jgi:hypothetical protein
MSNNASTTNAPQPVEVNRVPLWLAVAVTVVLSLPFGLWLGKFNFTLWCAFISWAEYFALGAKPRVVPTIMASFGYAAVLTGFALAIIPLFGFLPNLVTAGDLPMAAAFFIVVGFMVYSMKWSHHFLNGSLPFFNGISMALGVYFTGSYPQLGPTALLPITAAIWATAMAAFGVLLGILTIALQFPAKRPA